MRLPPPRALLLGTLLLAPLLLPPPVRAELWQWTDGDGTVRYTPERSRVPSSRRGSAVRVEPGMAMPATPAPAAAPEPPAALHAPADDVDFAADPFNAPDQARTLRAEPLPAPPPPAPPARTAAEPATSVPPVSAAPAEVASPAPPTPTRAAPGGSVSAAPPPAEVARPAPAAPAPASTSTSAAAAPAPPAPAATAPVGAAPASVAATNASAAAPAPSHPPRQSPAEARARRDELEAQIAADEARLKELISAAGSEEGLDTSPELREIARRLPRLQAELRALEGASP